ncbi:hypothetical protein HY629_02765 [Candidatus Uhrbacteria bacterium]|nr:hypothetical protein [Candidatus Uhrbacteria bacterium]
MRHWIYIGILLVLIAAGLWWWAPLWQGGVIAIDLYGTSADGAMRRVEDILQTVRTQFGSRVSVTVHYLALRHKETNELYSVLLKSGNPAEIPAQLTTFDLEENQRRLVMQSLDAEKFWKYLAARNDNMTDYGWETAALRAGFAPDAIQERVTREGKEIQQNEIKNFETLAEARSEFQSLQLPALFIGNTLYSGAGDVMSITSAVAHALLRRGAPELTIRTPLRVGPMTIERASETSIFGVTECASDLHCNDRPTKDGFCADVGTLRAHCAYRAPRVVNLIVLADQPIDLLRDPIVDRMYVNFKGLVPLLLDGKSEQGAALKKQLQLKTLPAYLFDQSIEADPRLPTLLENNLVKKVEEGWYALTTQQ